MRERTRAVIDGFSVLYDQSSDKGGKVMVTVGYFDPKSPPEKVGGYLMRTGGGSEQILCDSKKEAVACAKDIVRGLKSSGFVGK